MTLPLFRLPAGALTGMSPGGTVRLDGPEGHHAATVRRLRVGESLQLADGSGLVAQGTATEVEPGVVTIRVTCLTEARPHGPRFVLVQALAKNDRDERAVEAATELGVDEVLAWQATRSIVVWRGERAERARRKWVTVAQAAAKQSRRATVPVVDGPLTSSDVARRIETAVAAYVLHEAADVPLATDDLPADDGDILLVVGPEGGITPEEIALFVSAGARPVRLGPTVLRSSTAGPAALAVLAAKDRWR